MNARAAARLLSLFALAGAGTAHADVTFHGFGQMVVGSTLSNDHSNFPNESYSADASFKPESLFALQVQAPLTSKLAATAQLVASGGNNDFTPRFEWAYVSYQVNNEWSLKAGRQRIPLYRYSDFLEVGQAYPWIRPPVSVYQSYISNFDGLSVNGYYELGDWTIQPQIVYGTINTTFTPPTGGTYHFDFTNDSGINVQIDYNDWLSFRLGWSYANATANVTQLDSEIQLLQSSCELTGFIPSPPAPLPNYLTTCTNGGGTQTPVDNSTAVNGLQAKNDSVIFYSGGLEIHKYNFIAISEYVGLRFNDSVLQRQNQWYASLGYRAGKFTPMLTFGHVDQASSNPGVVNQVAPGSGVPYINPATGQPLTLGTYSVDIPASLVVSGLVNAQRALSDYYEGGLRYDITKFLALKLDFTRFLNHNPPGYGIYTDSSGHFGNYQSNLLSAGFVFVF